MELALGVRPATPASTCPRRAPARCPTRQWLYYYWKQYKHYWCKHGKADGTYIQQIEYDDCKSG